MGTQRNQTVYRPWRPEEVEVLKEMYRAWPLEYDRLPGRTRQQIHSKASRLGLTRRAEVGSLYAHVTPTQWAYLAGIIDGEGTIHVFDGNTKRVRNGREYTVRGARRIVSVANTDEGLVAWLRETFPESGQYTQMPNPGAQFARKVPVHHVRWTRSGALQELLTGLIPYLIVKKEKAVALLDHINSLGET